MLKIKELVVSVEQKQILNSLNLEVKKGETVVIMGPNGSGKSTLGNVIMGNPNYTLESGEIEFDGENITDLEPDERAKEGIFLAQQYPTEVPGVSYLNFLRLAYLAQNAEEKLPLFKFRKLVRTKLEKFGLGEDFLERNLNEGFSGGEKKKAEILQLDILKPKVAILDETDSGLDVDALKQIFKHIGQLKKENPDMTLMIITHYERIFEFVTPDKVFVIQNGQIQKSGTKELAKEILESGFTKN